MKFDRKLLLLGIPLVAIVAIALIQTKYGRFAPAPPISIRDQSTQPIMPRSRAPQPTVLAPSADTSPLPPGGTATAPVGDATSNRSDELSGEALSEEPIPIPELRQAARPGGRGEL
jgi:hypothetical protein